MVNLGADGAIDWSAVDEDSAIDFGDAINFDLGDITVERGGVLAVDGEVKTLFILKLFFSDNLIFCLKFILVNGEDFILNFTHRVLFNLLQNICQDI